MQTFASQSSSRPVPSRPNYLPLESLIWACKLVLQCYMFYCYFRFQKFQKMGYISLAFVLLLGAPSLITGRMTCFYWTDSLESIRWIVARLTWNQVCLINSLNNRVIHFDRSNFAALADKHCFQFSLAHQLRVSQSTKHPHIVREKFIREELKRPWLPRLKAKGLHRPTEPIFYNK